MDRLVDGSRAQELFGPDNTPDDTRGEEGAAVGAREVTGLVNFTDACNVAEGPVLL